MLEEKNPERVPETSAAHHLVLASVTRLLQGELELLHSVWADVKGTFRFVDDLDFARGLSAAVDVNFGLFHLSLIQKVGLCLSHVSAYDVAQVASLLSA